MTVCNVKPSSKSEFHSNVNCTVFSHTSSCMAVRFDCTSRTVHASHAYRVGIAGTSTPFDDVANKDQILEIYTNNIKLRSLFV